MPTIFSRIISGDLPGHFVWRDDRCVVFLSINPMAPGHALVVPIDEIDHWIDVPADLNAHLFEVARTIGRAQYAAYACERVGVLVAGYEVPHVHIHVVPTNDLSELSFARAASHVDPAVLAENADLLVATLARMEQPGSPA